MICVLCIIVYFLLFCIFYTKSTAKVHYIFRILQLLFLPKILLTKNREISSVKQC